MTYYVQNRCKVSIRYDIIAACKKQHKAVKIYLAKSIDELAPLRGEIMKARKNLSQLWLPAIRVIQIILSIAVIVFILLQARGAGLGSVFGGSSAGTVFKTRRGVEKLIFNLTIVFVVLFAVVSLLSSLIK